MKFSIRMVEEGEGSPTITIKHFSQECLPEILMEIETFLRGCGFSIKGSIEVVDEEN